jgi:hypothetical protein
MIGWLLLIATWLLALFPWWLILRERIPTLWINCTFDYSDSPLGVDLSEATEITVHDCRFENST